MNDILLVQKAIRQGEYDKQLAQVYGKNPAVLSLQRNRYASAIQAFCDLFGKERAAAIYSTPGRAELSGNHTDHNGGIAMAMAVNADIIAVVSKTSDGIIRLRSRGYDKTIIVDTSSLEINETETGRSPSLVRGVAAGIKKWGGNIGGLDIYTSSAILKGSGLSSSAAFEVCIANILNHEYNNASLEPLTLAKIGHWAENTYYGKASGILDQIACALGGVIKADMKDISNPIIKQLPKDFWTDSYKMLITDTSGSHGNQIKEVSEICTDMQAVAKFFNKDILRDVHEKDFYNNINDIRAKLGDRCVLRAIHFFEECKRANLLYKSAKKHDIDAFLKIITEGGHSSFEYNQNAYNINKQHIQGIPIGLAITQKLLSGNGGYRLQGSGFAGTIQAFVPCHLVSNYKCKMEKVFGKNSCTELNVRYIGALKVI